MKKYLSLIVAALLACALACACCACGEKNEADPPLSYIGEDYRIVYAEGDAAAAQHLAVFAENPDLAVFLRKLDSMKRLMGRRTTLVLDTNSAPFDILKYGGFSLEKPAKKN